MLKDQIAVAVDVLRSGGIVAYPTDTLYGLAVDPRAEDAVERLFGIKARMRGHAVPLIAADLQQAEAAASFSESARRLAEAFWPGPLSIVLPAAPEICAGVVAADGTVAIRVPASPVAVSLAQGFGFAITATSANLTGKPPTASAAVVHSTLGSRVDFLLDAEDAPGGLPSTIVALDAEVPRLVREGAVPWNRVLESLK